VARRIRVGPSTGRPCRRNAGGRDCVYVVAHSVASIAVALLLYPVVAISGGIPLHRFALAALPPQLIAFSPSSSIASLPGRRETWQPLKFAFAGA